VQDLSDLDRELKDGCKVKVVQVLSDPDRELRNILKINSGFKGNSGLLLIWVLGLGWELKIE
jgi:hypothetical protein